MNERRKLIVILVVVVVPAGYLASPVLPLETTGSSWIGTGWSKEGQ